MNKKTIRDVDLNGKRVVMRADFNVPLEGTKVKDETRIDGALPTLRYLIQSGASVSIVSHLGRPKGNPNPSFSLRPVASVLSEKLGQEVRFVPDCVGQEAEAVAFSLKPGEVLLLENVRFHAEEEGKVSLPEDASEEEKKKLKCDMKEKQRVFASALARLGDLYVNDAFGTAHRAHASTSVITEFFEENVAGLLMEREISYLDRTLANPDRPFVAIIGGAKISGKIDVITNLMQKVDALIIGGGMAYTFYAAKDLPVGDSLVEKEKISLAGDILKLASEKGIRLLLPEDHVIANAFDASADRKVVDEQGIEEGWMALDIGPKTVQAYTEEIALAKTVLWNGPMGCFEMEPFAAGTMAVARAVADTECLSIIGGGDSVSAVKMSGLACKMTHISTGGGASLELLEGKALPGLVALTDKE